MNVFFIIGISFLIFTFILSRKINIKIKIPLLIIIAFVAYFLISSQTSKGDEEWYKETPWKHLILFGSMLLGIITNYFVGYLQARIKVKKARIAEEEKEESERKKIKMPPFIWEEFFLPIVISGVLFGYFWLEHGKEEISFAVLYMSYQNGFFWQTIYNKLKSK